MIATVFVHYQENRNLSVGARENRIKYPPFHTCRHLLQNSSMTLDTMSDLTRDIMELADNDITDKVRTHLLQK